MKISRSDLAKLAAGALVGIGLAVAIGAGPLQPVGPTVVSSTSTGQFIYRVWSDGKVEINDPSEYWGGNQEFKGWKEVK